MWKTIARRFLMMIPQLFVLSLIIFILAQFMPGDPFTGAGSVSGVIAPVNGSPGINCARLKMIKLKTNSCGIIIKKRRTIVFHILDSLLHLCS